MAVFVDLYGNRWDLWIELNPMKLVVASSNAGKLAEFRDLLGDSRLSSSSPRANWASADAEETGLTFVENALLKARNAARATGLPALADDSGLCVDALGGAPGLYSARYAGAHGDAQANIAKLLDAMKDVPHAQRSAHFYRRDRAAAPCRRSAADHRRRPCGPD